jgi:hypothetical protein
MQPVQTELPLTAAPAGTIAPNQVDTTLQPATLNAEAVAQEIPANLEIAPEIVTPDLSQSLPTFRQFVESNGIKWESVAAKSTKNAEAVSMLQQAYQKLVTEREAQINGQVQTETPIEQQAIQQTETSILPAPLTEAKSGESSVFSKMPDADIISQAQEGVQGAIDELKTRNLALPEAEGQPSYSAKFTQPNDSGITVYTGSDEPFTKFDTSRIGKRTDAGFAGRGAYTTTDQAKAERWGKNVLETTIPQGTRFLEIDKQSELYEKHGMQQMSPEENNLPIEKRKQTYAKYMNNFAAKKLAEGYDGVKWNMSSGDTQYVLFEPEKYIFNKYKKTKPAYSAAQSTTNAPATEHPITQPFIQSIWGDSKIKDNGTFQTITTPAGVRILLSSVAKITPNEIAFQAGRSSNLNESNITGEFQRISESLGTIKLVRNQSGDWTLAHESGHALQELILNQTDRSLLKDYVKGLVNRGILKANDAANHGNKEDISDFIADQLTGNTEKYKPNSTINRIIAKLRDFVDRIKSAFGVRTVNQVVEDIKTGQILHGRGVNQTLMNNPSYTASEKKGFGTKVTGRIFNRLVSELNEQDYGIDGLLADWNGSELNADRNKIIYNDTRSSEKWGYSKGELIDWILSDESKSLSNDAQYQRTIDTARRIIREESGLNLPSYSISDTIKSAIGTFSSTFNSHPEDMPANEVKSQTDFFRSQKNFSKLDYALSVPFRFAQKYPEWREMWKIHGIDRQEMRSDLRAKFIATAAPFFNFDKEMKAKKFSNEQIKESLSKIERTLITGDALGQEYTSEQLSAGIQDETGKTIQLNPDEIKAYTSVREGLNNVRNTLVDWLSSQSLRNYKRQKWYGLLAAATGIDLNADNIQSILGEKGLNAAALGRARKIQVDVKALFDRMEQGITEIPSAESIKAGELYKKIATKMQADMQKFADYLGEITGVKDKAALANLAQDVFDAYVKIRPQVKIIKQLRNEIGNVVGYFPRYREGGEYKMRLLERQVDENGDIALDDNGIPIEDKIIFSKLFSTKSEDSKLYKEIMSKYAKDGKLPDNYILTRDPITTSPESAFQGVNDVNLQKVFDDAMQSLQNKGSVGINTTYTDSSGNEVNVFDQLRAVQHSSAE